MSSTEKTQALEQYLRSNGAYINPNITVVEDSASGVHLRAHSRLEAESSIVSIPHTLCLSYLNALVEDAWPVFKEHRHRFKVEAIGFWYLAAQYLHRETSFWRPYLDSLPSPESEHTQPLFFEDTEDVAWLEGTDVWHTHLGRTEVHRGYYDEGIAILQEAGVDVTGFTW